MKYLKLLLLISFAFLFFSCDIFEEDEEDIIEDEIIQDSSIFIGLYEKNTGGVYLKITSSKGYLCSSNNEFSGNISGNTIYFNVGDDIIETQLRKVGSNIEARQLINNNYDEWTLYYQSSDQYPCDNNGNNGTSEGEVVFYTSSDLGCGPITVTLSGVGTSSMNVYFPNEPPSCGSGSAVTFNDLTPGTYSWNASCQNYTWNATVQIISNTCTQQRLSL